MTHTTSIEDARSACNTEGLPTDSNTVNFRPHGAIKKAPDGRVADIATQLECLTLAGLVIHKDSVGDFTVCKFGMTCYCKDFARLLG